MQIACELNHPQACWVILALYIAYTVMALSMSMIIRHAGFKTGMVLSAPNACVGRIVELPLKDAALSLKPPAMISTPRNRVVYATLISR
ncbi:MAG: hypothetical protein CM1200mP41_39130 [Gammaproteobacteria bacterium]|nr:MAG: hypothetical protein CM1200mP41_39130 [Gammaproteobacteria bacterium]